MKKLIVSGLLLMSLFVVGGCTDSADLSLADVRTCLAPGQSGCGAEQTVFGRDAEEIFVTAVLNDAAPGTKVDFAWKFVDGSQDIDTVTLTADQAGASNLEASLPKPTFEGGWPAGDYEVRIKVQNHPEVKTTIKDFSIQ